MFILWFIDIWFWCSVQNLFEPLCNQSHHVSIKQILTHPEHRSNSSKSSSKISFVLLLSIPLLSASSSIFPCPIFGSFCQAIGQIFPCGLDIEYQYGVRRNINCREQRGQCQKHSQRCQGDESDLERNGSRRLRTKSNKSDAGVYVS